MQGTNQLVRSNWGLSVLLRDTLTRPGWDRTGNPLTAWRQLLPPEPYSHIAISPQRLFCMRIPISSFWDTQTTLSGINNSFHGQSHFDHISCLNVFSCCYMIGWLNISINKLIVQVHLIKWSLGVYWKLYIVNSKIFQSEYKSSSEFQNHIQDFPSIGGTIQLSNAICCEAMYDITVKCATALLIYCTGGCRDNLIQGAEIHSC